MLCDLSFSILASCLHLSLTLLVLCFQFDGLSLVLLPHWTVGSNRMLMARKKLTSLLGAQSRPLKEWVWMYQIPSGEYNNPAQDYQAWARRKQRSRGRERGFQTQEPWAPATNSVAHSSALDWSSCRFPIWPGPFPARNSLMSFNHFSVDFLQLFRYIIVFFSNDSFISFPFFEWLLFLSLSFMSLPGTFHRPFSCGS